MLCQFGARFWCERSNCNSIDHIAPVNAGIKAEISLRACWGWRCVTCRSYASPNHMTGSTLELAHVRLKEACGKHDPCISMGGQKSFPKLYHYHSPVGPRHIVKAWDWKSQFVCRFGPT